MTGSMTISRTVYQVSKVGREFIKYINYGQIHVVKYDKYETYKFKNDMIKCMFFAELKKMPGIKPIMMRDHINTYRVEKAITTDAIGDKYEIIVYSHIQLLMPDDLVIVSRQFNQDSKSCFYGFVTEVVDEVFSKKILATSLSGDNRIVIDLSLADDDSVIDSKIQCL